MGLILFGTIKWNEVRPDHILSSAPALPPPATLRAPPDRRALRTHPLPTHAPGLPAALQNSPKFECQYAFLAMMGACILGIAAAATAGQVSCALSRAHTKFT